MAKVKQTKSGNVRITLSQEDAGKLWGILAVSHIPKHPDYAEPSQRAAQEECESVSIPICAALDAAGLRYYEISPEGKASREDIPS